MVDKRSLSLKSPAVLVEIFVVLNLAFLSVDIVIAHAANQFARWTEWIPFYFSAASAAALIISFAHWRLAGTDRLHRRTGFAVGWLAVAVGILGMLLHLKSQFFVDLTIKSLVYTAPFIAPLSYTGLGFLLLLNRMVDVNSAEWHRWVIFLALGGFWGSFILSLCDHAQNGFFSAAEWIPVISTAFMSGFLLLPVIMRTSNPYLRWCRYLLAGQMAVGGLGFVLHLQGISRAATGGIWDSLIYGAPLFAPLLLPNLALLALIGMSRYQIGQDS